MAMANKRGVKFGLAFQASQPFSHYAKCTALAKKYGFDMIQVYDDLLFKPAWPILFSLTSLIRESGMDVSIGPGVVNPYHCHPALIAANLACLQEETEGRAFVMVGRGAFHDLFRIEQKRPLFAVKEAIEIIYNLLSGRDPAYDGSVFKVKSGARLRWVRSQSSCETVPKIWIGTWGEKMCELAGAMKQVSGVMISSITNPKYIELLKSRIAKGALNAGRNPSEIEVGVVPGTIVSNDSEKAFCLAREASAVYLPYLHPMTEFVGIKPAEIDQLREAILRNPLDMKEAASLVPPKAVDAFKLWGTPDEIIEKTSALVDSGVVDRINFGFGRGPEDLDGIELLGSKVLPYFRIK